MINDCWHCKHSREILWDCHLTCAKPDPNMKGDEHGVANGWFFYPWNYDPIWMTVKCANFESTIVKDTDHE